jgi:hypothetical protein|tara:strand:- start:1738 stop:2517 length:780 start_codon:yes stop_codon:yes gene_type:complete
VEVNEHTGEVMLELMKTSKELNEIAKALSDAQAKFPVLPKTKKVTVKTHDGKSYSYSYADLATIIETILPITSKHGLSIVQLPTIHDGRSALKTRLLHTSGQWIECELPLRTQRDGAQAMGSALTYMRRYGISAILCLATDEDEDGQLADTDHVGATPQVKKGVPIADIPSEKEARKFVNGMIRDGKKMAEIEENGLIDDAMKEIEGFWLENQEKIAQLKKVHPELHEELRQEFGFLRDKLQQDSAGEDNLEHKGEKNG